MLTFNDVQCELLQSHGFEVAEDRRFAEAFRPGLLRLRLVCDKGNNYALHYPEYEKKLVPRSWPDEAASCNFNKILNHAVAALRYFETRLALDESFAEDMPKACQKA